MNEIPTYILWIGVASILAILGWLAWIFHPRNAGECDLHIEKDERGRDWVVCTTACGRNAKERRERIRTRVP